MRAALVLLAACGGPEGADTVAYTDPDGQVEVVDVASGAITPIDPGLFGSIAISPDGAYVAYFGTDGVPKLNDLAGGITNLPASTQGGGFLQWWGQTLTYADFDPSTSIQRVEVVRPGQPPRSIVAQSYALSNDGAHVATVDPSGHLAVEDVDGGHRTDVTTSSGGQFAFTDDGATLVFGAASLQSVQISAFDVATGAIATIGPGTTIQPLPGSSIVSPDGTEVLADDGANALVGYSLVDGSKRIYLQGRSNNGFAQLAGYLDNGLVVVDLGTIVTITDGVDPVSLASTDRSQCFALQVSRPLRQILMSCSTSVIVDFAGQLVSSRAAITPVGISSDGAGLISLDGNGRLEITTASGTRLLANVMPPNNAIVSSPFAAYAP